MGLTPQFLQRRLTLLENIVVLFFALILIVVVIDRAEKLMVEAEEAALTATLSNINSAYYLLVAQLIIHDQLASVERFRGSNPFELEGLLLSDAQKGDGSPFHLTFSAASANYRGACVAGEELAPRYWCFDREHQELHYRIENVDYVEGGAGEPVILRFAVQLSYQDLNKNHRYDYPVDQFERLTLQPMSRYQWRHSR